MSEYWKETEIMECDYYRTLSPRQLMIHALSAILVDMRIDGCGRDALLARCNAVWMISRVRIDQFASLPAEDRIIYRTNLRASDGVQYLFSLDGLRDGIRVFRFEVAFVPVDTVKRKLIRLADVEPLWNTTAQSVGRDAFPRLRLGQELSFRCSDMVRLSDCDINHHLTASSYLSFICDALDYWQPESSRYMRFLQCDYLSEVMPGTELRLFTGNEEKKRLVRGVKPDGTVAFEAACIFSE